MCVYWRCRFLCDEITSRVLFVVMLFAVCWLLCVCCGLFCVAVCCMCLVCVACCVLLVVRLLSLWLFVVCFGCCCL